MFVMRVGSEFGGPAEDHPLSPGERLKGFSTPPLLPFYAFSPTGLQSRNGSPPTAEIGLISRRKASLDPGQRYPRSNR